MSDKTPDKNTCLRCGHTWHGKSHKQGKTANDRPKQCAKCRRRNWDKRAEDVKRGPPFGRAEIVFKD